MDWRRGVSHFSNIEVESSFCPLLSLPNLLHASNIELPEDVFANPLLYTPVKAWRQIRKLFKLNPFYSVHEEFLDNPDFIMVGLLLHSESCVSRAVGRSLIFYRMTASP